MPPKVSDRDWFVAHAVLRGKYCAECGVKKWHRGIYCDRCFDRLPETLQRHLHDKDLWIAAYRGAKVWFLRNPIPLK